VSAAAPGRRYPGLPADAARAKAHAHRAQTPEDAYARFAPLARRMGVTRVGALTGLDTLGVPVCFAARPNSRSIAVHQGKGLTLAGARISALMEAAETWHAEDVLAPVRLARAADLRAAGLACAWRGLPLARAFDDHQPIPWVAARDVATGGEVLVPLEAVSSDYTAEAEQRFGGYFEATTNGLASGSTVAEALAHGLCEVIERDAVALWRLREGHREPALDLDRIQDPGCRWLLERFASAGVRVRLWDATSDAGVPTYLALAVDAGETATDPEVGSACHPSPVAAMVKALAEAAQARTTWIAGARDDFEPALYQASARSRRRRDSTRWLDGPADAPPEARPDLSTDSVLGDLEAILDRLAAVGIEQVLYVDLTRPDIGIPVVRTLVPGLESPLTGEDPAKAGGARAAQAGSGRGGRP
ncbi:YcaO-like family protein, partial [Alsobacter soli]|uniref:YcaO-like family protein n=1 Tax=Alsobacter soli TaxID=2109933 RepID=UPI001304EF94